MSGADSFPIGAAASLAELAGDPHPLLHRLRSTEPVSWLPAIDGWLVTRLELATKVMRDSATFTVDDPRFSTAKIVGQSMLSRDGREHARHRDPFAPAFRQGAVRGWLAEIVEEEIERLLDAMRSDATDLRRDLAGPLSVAVMVRALGLREIDPAVALGWYAAIVTGVDEITAGGEPGPKAAEAFGALTLAVEAALDSDPTRSLVAAAHRDGGLDAGEIASNVAVLLFGGIETTEAMIANAFHHLLDNPDQLARVRADLQLVPNAIEESLRLEPAAAVVDRYATREVTIAAATIRAGELVRVSIAGANRDPQMFPEPDSYDVRRANARQHLAFAHGPHVCLGIHLARLEAELAVRRTLERFPGLRPDPTRPATVAGLVFRKPDSVSVCLGDDTRGASAA